MVRIHPGALSDSMDISEISKIARLKLTKTEKEKFQKQFKKILDYFKELDKIKNKKEFSVSPFEIVNVFDEDKIEKSLSEKEALSQVKNKDIGFFKSPRVVK